MTDREGVAWLGRTVLLTSEALRLRAIESRPSVRSDTHSYNAIAIVGT